MLFMLSVLRMFIHLSISISYIRLFSRPLCREIRTNKLLFLNIFTYISEAVLMAHEVVLMAHDDSSMVRIPLLQVLQEHLFLPLYVSVLHGQGVPGAAVPLSSDGVPPGDSARGVWLRVVVLVL